MNRETRRKRSQPQAKATEKGREEEGKRDGLGDFFSTLDRWIDVATEGVAKRFSPGTAGHHAIELLEPALAGFATSILLWLLDLALGNGAGSSLYEHFLKSTLEHVKPLFLSLGFVSFGFGLVLSGAAVSQALRKIFVSPVLRLMHHIVLMACGAAIAVALKEGLTGQIDWRTAGQLLLFTMVALPVGAASYLCCHYISDSYLQGLERKHRSLRLLVTFGGLALLISGLPEMKEQAQKMAEAQQVHSVKPDHSKAIDAPADPGSKAEAGRSDPRSPAGTSGH